MTVFEYASGLTSIVVGLAVARILGGISTFSSAGGRSAYDWIVGAWCLALLFTLVGFWMAGWVILRERTEIEFVTLSLWIVGTSFDVDQLSGTGSRSDQVRPASALRFITIPPRPCPLGYTAIMVRSSSSSTVVGCPRY